MIIGVTGGMGSGKSYVSKILSQKGYELVDADQISREVTEKGSPALKELANYFGSDILFEDGSLNRKLLKEKAFKDDESTGKLNEIVTSEIIKIAKDRLVGNCIFDAPTLFENHLQDLTDFNILVFSNKETRIKRVRKRDNMTRKQILSVMEKQMPERDKMKLADYVLKNNGSKDDLNIAIDKMFCLHPELAINH